MSAQLTKMIAAEMIAFFEVVRAKFENAQDIEDQEGELKKIANECAKKCAKKIEKKDVPKVKGKKTAYMLFCAQNRDPSMNFKESSQYLSKKWKDLNEEDRAAFLESVKDELEEDAKRYQDEKALVEEKTSEPGSKKPKQKKEIDPNAPKRPLGSYMLFCKDARASDSSLNSKGGASRLGELWNGLSDEKKNEYKEAAKAAMEAYKKEMESYKSSEKVSSDDSDASEQEKPKKKAKKSSKKAEVEIDEDVEKTDAEKEDEEKEDEEKPKKKAKKSVNKSEEKEDDSEKTDAENEDEEKTKKKTKKSVKKADAEDDAEKTDAEEEKPKKKAKKSSKKSEDTDAEKPKKKKAVKSSDE